MMLSAKEVGSARKNFRKHDKYLFFNKTRITRKRNLITKSQKSNDTENEKKTRNKKRN